MTRADFWGGLILTLFFGAALWEAWSFQYGTEFSPGPGFAPVWLSAVGLCVSLAIVAHGLWSMRGSEDAKTAAPEPLDRPGVGRVAASLAGLVAMVVVMPWLGLLLALLAFLLFLTLVVQRHSLLVGAGASLGTVIFVYFVFVHFLEVAIPKGPLGL